MIKEALELRTDQMCGRFWLDRTRVAFFTSFFDMRGVLLRCYVQAARAVDVRL